MWIGILGRFSVLRDGEEVPPAAFGGRLVRALVRILLTRRGELVPKDVLVDALWGERAPADPVRNLEILVVRARRALGDPSLIETGPAGYLFARTADCEVDAERFVELAEAGRRHLRAGRPDAALRAFREALDRWGGEPLPEDAYSDWAQEPRRELARRYLDTLEAAAVAALGAGDHAGAVLYAERAVGREPLRETSNLLLVQALAASGDTAGALRAFDSFRGTLAEEVGLDPSPQAMELQVRILRGEQLPEARMAGVSAAVPRAPTGESPFVGREAELAAVLQAADGAGPVLVSGPAGAGKSRLLAEAASRSPVPALSVRAFLAERAEPWTLGRSLVREALALDVDAARAVTKHGARALAEVIPEIEDLRDVPRLSIDPESRRALALEGAVQMAEASGARLVLVDDAQWADPTSLVLLVLLAERTGIGLVVAYRPEEVGSRTPLADAVEALLRGDARKVSLGPLPPGAVAGLVADRELARVIAEETDGTPLAVIEVLQALEREGAIGRARDGRFTLRAEPAAGRAREAARAGQRSAIGVRSGRLPPDARSELERLALLGREVPARLLARAAGREQREILQALDALAAAGLARLGEAGWATAHDLVAETISASIGREHRARLHAELAEALRAEGADPAEVATHLAGAGDPVAAARAYADASQRALLRFANDEAERLADTGLALGPDEATHAALLGARGDARTRRGDLTQAEADLREVLARTPTGPAWSRTMSRLAWLVAGQSGYEHGLELAEAAIAAAGRDRAARAEALAVAGRIDMNLGDLGRSRARSDEALAIFEDMGDAEGIARVLDVQAIVTFEEGELRGAVRLFDRAATLFSTRGDLFRAVMPLATRSRALSLMGRDEEALADADRALSLARMLGFPEGECYALLQRVFPLAHLGRIKEAIADAEGAVALAGRLGHREWLSAATAGRATAHQAAGEVEAAEADFRSALELAEGMPIHTAVAASGLAGLLATTGRAPEAVPLVERALAASQRNRGARHSALLAQAEVAAALAEPGAAELAALALGEAEKAGHSMSVPRLRTLAGQTPETTGGARRSS